MSIAVSELGRDNPQMAELTMIDTYALREIGLKALLLKA
jgi:hypothetical protein